MNASSLSQGFIAGLRGSISEGHYSSEIMPSIEENESELVRGVLHMLQGFSSSLFYWNSNKQEFCVKTGIYASHLSQASLHCALDQFVSCGTCLKLVELFVKKVEASHDAIPTLRAFAGCVSSWLKRLRDISLEEETKSMGSSIESTTTLLHLGSSLSSICSGAEYLLHIVYGAIPCSYFKSEPCVPACEFATHILDHLFLKLNEVSLVQGGEEESYHMLVAIFTGTLLPYLDGLHPWLSNGTLDDPFEEMFFCANNAVSIGQPEFWEKSYFYRERLQVNTCPSVSPLSSDGGTTRKGTCKNDVAVIVCPLFLKDVAKAIVSAGKSLQLFRHVHGDGVSMLIGDNDHTVGLLGTEKYSLFISQLRNIVDGAKVGAGCSDSVHSENGKPNTDEFDDQTTAHLQHVLYNKGMGMLSLSEIFLISLVGLIGDWINMHKYAANPYSLSQVLNICVEHALDENDKIENNDNILQENSPNWLRFMVDRITKNSRLSDTQREFSSKLKLRDEDYTEEEMMKNEEYSLGSYSKKWLNYDILEMNQISVVPGFYPENPILTICRNFLMKNKDYWDDLNISSYSQLPPLSDESLRKTIFGESFSKAGTTADQINTGSFSRSDPSKLNFDSKFSDFEYVYQEGDVKTLNSLFPFPTFLPCCQENTSMSDLIPFQNNSSLASSVLRWIQSFKPKISPLPAVIIRECLTVYIRKQVDHVGKDILLKLMSDWKLMDELGVLRAIYLLGSGDLLQQFLTVIFDKLDRGDSLDDEFELNTMLQASIRNSADGRVLTAPDSLVISITKDNFGFGIDALDLLKFTYKVSWPLDLIINLEAINKYNQVMGFLLKVKRAKFALDKARKWMWKCKGKMSPNDMHHLLMEQKLLHFVDAFHQYVMDRVFHSAWLELCNGMVSATSLDEVIEVHEAYLLSIQRQCFVAPDKLWALIASRIKIILGLALDFYSVQQTLVSGGATSAIKTRCEMEVDRIEKQFDDCIAFLLRILSFKLNVGHFPHLADLVTRINYNYFYMSANGNLLTVPSFETCTKSAKPFAGFSCVILLLQMGSATLLKILAKTLNVLAGPMITLVYPLYASVMAIESKSPAANQQWLTYWVLYSLLTLSELSFARFLQWIPFLYYAKFVGTCWLVLPYFSGAAYVYDNYVRPFVLKQKPIMMNQNIIKPSDMLRVAEEYIAENVPRFFKMLNDKTGNLTNRSGSSSSSSRPTSLLEEIQADQEARLRIARGHYSSSNYTHFYDDDDYYRY